MIDAATDARQAVSTWLQLEADDPACNDARDTVAALGSDVLQRAAGVTAGSCPTRATGEALETAIEELRCEIRDLDAGGAGDSGWFGRVVAKVPGVGSPAERHARRLASVRPRIESMLRSVEAERAVLSRDNVTLRADLELLHELESDLDNGVRLVQAYVDALEFAVDVEVPQLDPRRTLFEDELLAGARRRIRELERARVTNREGLEAIESTMEANRSVMREIEALTRTASNRLETR